jgi:hypothetical protein
MGNLLLTVLASVTVGNTSHHACDDFGPAAVLADAWRQERAVGFVGFGELVSITSAVRVVLRGKPAKRLLHFV